MRLTTAGGTNELVITCGADQGLVLAAQWAWLRLCPDQLVARVADGTEGKLGPDGRVPATCRTSSPRTIAHVARVTEMRTVDTSDLW